ncbi:unnamed protein product, partial [Adineta steineri]
DDQEDQLSQATAENTNQRVSSTVSSSEIAQLTILQEQDSFVNKYGPERMCEGAECDYSLGLPVFNASKRFKKDDEQSITH